MHLWDSHLWDSHNQFPYIHYHLIKYQNQIEKRKKDLGVEDSERISSNEILCLYLFFGLCVNLVIDTLIVCNTSSISKFDFISKILGVCSASTNWTSLLIKSVVLSYQE